MLAVDSVLEEGSLAIFSVMSDGASSSLGWMGMVACRFTRVGIWRMMRVRMAVVSMFESGTLMRERAVKAVESRS